jgi:hypothetical protein
LAGKLAIEDVAAQLSQAGLHMILFARDYRR